MKVIVDPVDDILYMSFYVYGLEKKYGSNNVHFSSKPFRVLSQEARHTKSTRFIVEKDGEERKYAIHGNDSYKINEELYDWCDAYGCVNTNFDKTPVMFHKKLVALCPSFGIRCWNASKTIYHAISNCPDARTSVRKFWGKHKRLLQRPKYSDYGSPPKIGEGSMSNNYIFLLSTLWYSDEWNKNNERVNLRRARFIRACKELEEVHFEGGVVSQGKERSSEDLFVDCLCEGISMKEWMEKTKRSALVFNTPAFWDCHGWKLGEYLALGKCIISTPLSNDLPAPLEHGKNIHFVENNQESMREAVKYIVSHPDYQEQLEQGARAYWEQYGTPEISLKLLGL